MRPFLSFALILAVFESAARAATGGSPLLSQEAIKQIDAIFAQWDNTRSPGAAVAVSRGGQVIFARGYGMADLQHDVPITPDSIFHVASISKQFTTACVQLLAQDGKLSWADDVRRYVPELRDYGRAITLAHLAHHTSGLRDQWSLLGFAGWRDDDLITEDDVLTIASRQKRLNFSPSDEYLYCNTGFTLLAVVVKRVSGQSLRDFAAARIFQPLGMTATHFHSDHTEIVRGRTSAYAPRSGGGWKISIPVFDTYGATSLFTTVGDLLKWEANFTEPRVGGATFVEAMTTPGRLNDGRVTGYALGLRSAKPRGVVEVGHSGADAGYRSDVVRFPEHDLAISVFCNLSTMQPVVLSRQVADIVLGPGVMTSLPAPIAVEAAKLKELAGTYWNSATDEVQRVRWANGVLTASGSADPLVPIGPGLFRVGASGTRFTFAPAAPDAPQELGVTSVSTPELLAAQFRRVADWTPARAELEKFTGVFSSEEVLGARITVSLIVDDALELRAGRDAFTGAGTVSFQRSSSGEIIGLTLSSGRVRRLPLTKIAAP